MSSCVRGAYVWLEAFQVLLLFARVAQFELLELDFFCLVSERAFGLQALLVGPRGRGSDRIGPGDQVDRFHVEHSDGLDRVSLLVAREVLADDCVFLAEARVLVFGLLRGRLERLDELDRFDSVPLAHEVFDLLDDLLFV